MWHSEDDIINDLAALNDFGEPGNTEPYKILYSVGRGSKAKKESPLQPRTILDPRTGEEIEVSDDCLSLEDVLCRGVGRGSVLVSKNYSLLHKQLRLARPFGSGDEIIESYYKNNSARKVEACQSDFESEKLYDEKTSVETDRKSRIKGVRNSTLVKNALMANLLRTNPDPDAEVERSSICSEPEVLGRSVNDCDIQNEEVTKNGIDQLDSHSENPSENSSSWERSEDTTSECNSKVSNSQKVKRFAEKSLESIDLSEDLIPNLSFIAEDEEIAYPLKNENASSNIIDCKDAGQALERNETYRKLGERMNDICSRKQYGVKMQKNHCIFKVPRISGCQASFSKNFMYDDSNFPPLA